MAARTVAPVSKTRVRGLYEGLLLPPLTKDRVEKQYCPLIDARGKFGIVHLWLNQESFHSLDHTMRIFIYMYLSLLGVWVPANEYLTDTNRAATVTQPFLHCLS